MTPLDAVRREISAELDALEQRIGSGPMPDVVVVRLELDRAGSPKAVTVDEQRRRHILGGAVPAQRPTRLTASPR